MAKKLLTVWLSLTILLFSSISICAEETVQAEYFNKNIVVNGVKLVNYQSDNPFFLYKNMTYFPLTAEMGNILGFKWDMNWESRTVTLTKTAPTQQNFSQQWMKTNQTKIAAEVLTDVKLKLVAEEQINPIAGFVNSALDVAAQVGDSDTNQADTEPARETEAATEVATEAVIETVTADQPVQTYEILAVGDVIYVPLGALKADPVFGWDMYFDSYTGVYLTTDGITTAVSTFNEPESRYNKGLVNYVISSNKNYTVAKAQNLVFLFKQEAAIFKMDPLLLMAVAHKESTFTASARSSGGALGMMQVMPATGARYGLTKADLLDAHKNVEFGTLYLKERITAYNGDLTKALSAYNQGSASVNRGGFSTRYANQVQLKYDKMKYFLSTNGYGTGLQAAL